MDSLFNHLKLKVCGMREPENIKTVSALQPDFMGFIFYALSPRHVLNASEKANVSSELQAPESLPAMLHGLKVKGITPVAVCVDASEVEVLTIAKEYGFTAVQLHGHESPTLCRQLKDKGLTVFKAFSVATADDVRQTAAYEGCCDSFLFDTKTSLPGGSGLRFDWSILHAYQGNTPFFLSGGVAVSSVQDIVSFSHPQLYGLDVNSRFETEPGLKDASMLRQFIAGLSIK
jgi:phosphoribosylanthranilate isomerase